MTILVIPPKYAVTFWSFKNALRFSSKKGHVYGFHFRKVFAVGR